MLPLHPTDIYISHKGLDIQESEYYRGGDGVSKYVRQLQVPETEEIHSYGWMGRTASSLCTSSWRM